MRKNRLEAFSDGVIAIIITIMVLELKVPHGSDWSALLTLKHKFLSYIISFLYIAIYWHNHHHIFQAVEKINGRILWANTGLLFFLSLLPFVTAWAGENNFSQIPVSLYGMVLFLSAIAYFILIKEIVRIHDENSFIKSALGSLKKEIICLIFHVVGFVLTFFFPKISMIIYLIVGIMWIVPEKRIEKNCKK